MENKYNKQVKVKVKKIMGHKTMKKNLNSLNKWSEAFYNV